MFFFQQKVPGVWCGYCEGSEGECSDIDTSLSLYKASPRSIHHLIGFVSRGCVKGETIGVSCDQAIRCAAFVTRCATSIVPSYAFATLSASWAGTIVISTSIESYKYQYQYCYREVSRNEAHASIAIASVLAVPAPAPQLEQLTSLLSGLGAGVPGGTSSRRSCRSCQEAGRWSRLAHRHWCSGSTTKHTWSQWRVPAAGGTKSAAPVAAKNNFANAAKAATPTAAAAAAVAAPAPAAATTAATM
ncbi:hypothetical protein MRB53_039777 [Persea americana]|nr:hypothetical protein MRB53_039777 [Persea americana]